MKRIYMVLIIMLMSGCTPEPGKYTNSGPIPSVLSETCINNVVYYKSAYQLAPAFKPDNTLYTC